MLKLGILGYPLEHSLSPAMHTAALQHLNINGEYKIYEVKEQDLEKEFNKLRKSGLRGLNITIPFKQKIIPYIDELSTNAKIADAVNTITFEESGKITGDNTDVTGFWDSLEDKIKESLKSKKISIIGSGGSAYALCAAFSINEMKNIKVFGRSKEKLLKLKEQFNSVETNVLANLDLTDTFLLINTTPIGMYPNTNESPVLKQELKKLPEGAIVYDIIYNPPETKLLKEAKSLSKKTINGVEMLVRQGAVSLNIWLKKDVAPLKVMRFAVEDLMSCNIPEEV